MFLHRDRLRPGIAAARAGEGHHAFLRAGRGRRDFALVPVMVECGEYFLLDKYFFADGAMLAFGQARLRAGRRDGGVDRYDVACRIDRFRLGIAAARAGIGHHAFLRAGRGRRDLAFVPVMVECGDVFLFDKNFVADGAMFAFGQARFRAGRRDGGIDHFGVIRHYSRFRLYLTTALAGICHHACLRASRRRRDLAPVKGMPQRRNLARLRLPARTGALFFARFDARRRGRHGPLAKAMLMRLLRAGGKADRTAERQQHRKHENQKLFHLSFSFAKFSKIVTVL